MPNQRSVEKWAAEIAEDLWKWAQPHPILLQDLRRTLINFARAYAAQEVAPFVAVAKAAQQFSLAQNWGPYVTDGPSYQSLKDALADPAVQADEGNLMLHWWKCVAIYQAVAHALHVHKGNRTRAATMLGIERAHLYYLLRPLILWAE